MTTMTEWENAAAARELATDRLTTILQVVQSMMMTTTSTNTSNTTTNNNTITFSYNHEKLLSLTLRRLNQEEYQALQDSNNKWAKPTTTTTNTTTVDIFILTDQEEGGYINNINLQEYVSNNRLDGWIVLDFTTTSITDTTTTTTMNETKGMDATTTTTTTTAAVDDETDDNDTTAIGHFHLLPPGIHCNTLISNSIINVQTCRVYRNTLISQVYIGSHTLVLNCGQLLGRPPPQQQHHHHHHHHHHNNNNSTTFDVGMLNITVGAESGGGRDLILPAEATMNHVTQQLIRQPASKTTVTTTTTTTTTTTMPFKVKLPFTVIADGACIRDTPTIRNIFMYPMSSIVAASSINQVVLFPQAKITNASVVTNVIMQWDTSITDHSHINHVMMMEQSHCGPSSRVSSSVLGPDTHTSHGEIHASIIGPNTNAHHQSLLIGVLWPCGRGNVAYGANIGSNHTGRLPDQETTVGEGIFWGLSCIVKLPLDLTLAPYSIVAAGIHLSPAQRIGMPFSLIVNSTTTTIPTTSDHGNINKNNEINNEINNNNNEINNNNNEIIPGWVLQSSPYTLVRNEQKYATRRKAKRHSFYTGWKILRPATIDMCRAARNLLLLTRSSHFHHGTGMGNNIVTERGRNVGIKAYTQCIQRYVLQGLYTWVMETMNHPSFTGNMVQALECEFGNKNNNNNNNNNDNSNSDILTDFVSPCWPTFPWDPNELSRKEWEYQRHVLLEEFPMDDDTTTTTTTTTTTKNNNNNNSMVHWLKELLEKYVQLEQDFASRVAKSKARDDEKGAATIPGYADSHVSSNNDPIVRQVQARAKEIDDTVKTLLEKII
jgi:hypothetical protein